MIIKENGLRYAKLIHVSVDNGRTDNSNKVYIMEEMSDGRIKCDYGRVGKSLATVYKPTSQWDKILREKTGNNKGYTDVTELLAEPVVDDSQPKDNKVEAIKDAIVKKLIEDLMSYANKSIQKNYKVSQDAVSQQQVDAAQEIISKISALIKIGVDKKHVNDMLLKLYTVIPRKMDSVKNHLFDDIKDVNSLSSAQRLIDEEQSALDTMAGQVQLLKQQKDTIQKQKEAEGTDEVIPDYTILDQMGLAVEVENDSETLALIKKLMGPNVNQIKKVFKVVNSKTQSVFDKHMNTVTDKKKRYYFHGSRNENWFNILQTGLMIRPSGAVHTGSMFGDGIYFADKAQKSIGYTSLRGSYWTRGGDDKAFLALFDVHLGKQKEILHHSSSCCSLSTSVLKREGFDSVFAKGGADLRNNEFIVYNPAQCTVSHLIEIGN
jgi:poly [ADP-ribose] polymerase